MRSYQLLFQLLFVCGFLHSQSVVESHNFYSPALDEEKTFLIYLPDGYYDDTTRSYPVVYFLRIHETEWFNPEFRTNDETLKDVADNLIENKMIGKVIIVAPSTGGNTVPSSGIVYIRPGIINMLRPDLADDTGFGTGKFEDYLFQDFIPLIDSTYRTIPEWCARGVDGFSLGGYASTLFAMKHPGVFSSVGSYDGTIMWYKLDDPRLPGSFDDNFWVTIPALNVLVNPMFDFPRDSNYMRLHSAVDVLMNSTPSTLDSIQKISFHLKSGPSDLSGNFSRNVQLADSLASRGIDNTFGGLVLSPNAMHDYDWADVYARESLVKHWETFSSFSCDSLTTGTYSPAPRPPSIRLHQNFPNPFRSITTIAFELSEQSVVSLDIFDALGGKVKSLLHGTFPPGVHQILFDASGYAQGVYFCQLESTNQVQTRRLLVLK
jgi:Putative esterase/Secretion system C-terminal sorting domain